MYQKYQRCHSEVASPSTKEKDKRIDNENQTSSNTNPQKIGDEPRCSGRANIYCLKQVIFRIPILFGIDTDIGEKFELLEIHDSTSTNIPFLNSDLSKKTREPCVILHSLIQLFFISIRWRGILLFCICKNSSSWCNGYRVR
jgi:hypothetical protein